MPKFCLSEVTAELPPWQCWYGSGLIVVIMVEVQFKGHQFEPGRGHGM
jgi:hypothetical protein